MAAETSTEHPPHQPGIERFPPSGHPQSDGTLPFTFMLRYPANDLANMRKGSLDRVESTLTRAASSRENRE